MARSQTSRFSLWRWSADLDTQSRTDFDNDNAQIEALAMIGRQGVAASRGSASSFSRSTYWSTDTGVLEYSDGTSWLYVSSTAAPRGQIGAPVVNTTTQTNNIGATPVDLTGMTKTVTVAAGRRIRVSAKVPFRAQASGGITVALSILEGASILERAFVGNLGALEFRAGTASVDLTPSAGSHTYKLQAEIGTNLMDTVVSATSPAKLNVEDVGV